jgi:hypothetical protein
LSANELAVNRSYDGRRVRRTASTARAPLWRIVAELFALTTAACVRRAVAPLPAVLLVRTTADRVRATIVFAAVFDAAAAFVATFFFAAALCDTAALLPAPTVAAYTRRAAPVSIPNTRQKKIAVCQLNFRAIKLFLRGLSSYVVTLAVPVRPLVPLPPLPSFHSTLRSDKSLLRHLPHPYERPSQHLTTCIDHPQ